jgi:hypothetical protein
MFSRANENSVKCDNKQTIEKLIRELLEMDGHRGAASHNKLETKNIDGVHVYKSSPLEYKDLNALSS